MLIRNTIALVRWAWPLNNAHQTKMGLDPTLGWSETPRWCSCVLPRLQPLGPDSNPTGGTTWIGFSVSAWLHGHSVFFPPTSKTEITSSSSLLVWLLLERREYWSRSRSRPELEPHHLYNQSSSMSKLSHIIFIHASSAHLSTVSGSCWSLKIVLLAARPAAHTDSQQTPNHHHHLYSLDL